MSYVADFAWIQLDGEALESSGIREIVDRVKIHNKQQLNFLNFNRGESRIQRT